MTINIGIVGTDSSHVIAFTRILNNSEHPFYVSGGRVTKAVRYSSLDFELSYSREARFSSLLSDELAIPFVPLEELGHHVDAIMLEAADGRAHLELFKQLLIWNKPIFIDKPLATSYKEARDIIELASNHNIPVLSSSALRYSHVLKEALNSVDRTALSKVTVICPLIVEPTQSRYYWYGIHGVDMLYSILGTGCKQVDLQQHLEAEHLIGTWENNIIGEVQCVYDHSQPFEVILHFNAYDNDTDNNIEKNISISLSEADHKVHFYASLIDNVIHFFEKKEPHIPYDEMLEVIWFIEQAEQAYTNQNS